MEIRRLKSKVPGLGIQLSGDGYQIHIVMKSGE